MNEFKVIGHIAPDTDSTCSPIVYAWFLKNVENDNAVAYLSGEPNKEAIFVLNKLGVDKPTIISEFEKKDNIILIDTNNPKELLPGIEKASIVEIIDHHKLVGGLSTESPINITIRPTGCSATIIWQMIEHFLPEDAPEFVFYLLAAGIISDTLNLTSPTTTDQDRYALEQIIKHVEIDIDKFADEMFSAKSDVSDMSAKDILLADSKIFELGTKKVRIAVMETAKPDLILERMSEFAPAMESLKKEEKTDAIYLFIVDIVNSESKLIVSNEAERKIAIKAFDSKFDGELMNLPDTVSRKKQMVPNLEKVYTA